jgi:short-subunit dehydrogenase
MNVVITGAGKGIGRAIAIKYAREGHNVAICARTESDLEEVASNSPDQRIIYKTCDVSKPKDLVSLHDFVEKHAGWTDILINNAGIFAPGQIQSEEEGALEKQLDTNLFSAYRTTRLFLPGMIARRAGHIFNICSIASIIAYPNGGSYSISKFALYGMSKVLREEMKPHNIKVTSILPGATLTESWNGTELPPSRFIMPQDVAEIIYTTSMLSPAACIEDIILRPLEGDI